MVLVSGTLVYSRGDEREAKQIHEDMVDSGETDAETPRHPADPATPRPMPVTGSQPIHMRQTPRSFKVSQDYCLSTMLILHSEGTFKKKGRVHTWKLDTNAAQ